MHRPTTGKCFCRKPWIPQATALMLLSVAALLPTTRHYSVSAFRTATSPLSYVPVTGSSSSSSSSTFEQSNRWSPAPSTTQSPFSTETAATSTSLAALRTWNLNREPGASPFGLDLNAEVWNGRIAQVAFTWVFIQEWVQQKGVIKGLSDGDVINIVSAGVFAVLIAAVTVRFLLEPASAGSASRLSSRRPINTSTARVGAGSGGSGGGRLGVAGSGTGSYIAGSDYNNVPSIAKTVRDVTNPYEDRNNVFVNFNDGRSPFGLKANAEIWNGRIAMFSFVWVVVQEYLMDKGFLAAIEKGDTAAMVALGAELVAIVGFMLGMSTASFQDDYVERVVGKEALELNARFANQWVPPVVERPYELPPVESVRPGVGVSEPVTYEMYMQERARLEKAQEQAAWASSFSNSLKAMSASDVDSSSQSFQVYTAKNPSPAWTAKQSSSLDSSYTASLQAAATAAPGNAAAALDDSRMSLPFGAAYSPVVIKPGLYTSIQYPAPGEATAGASAATASTTVATAETSATPVPASTKSESASVAAVAVRPEFVGGPVQSSYMKDSADRGRPKPPITFRVDGYRFKPETQSAITSSPHPGGVFTFKSDTSMMIKSANSAKPKPAAPKPNPVAYPVEGFKFGENTKTLIKATDRTAVAAPEVTASAVASSTTTAWQPPTAPTRSPEPIVSPSYGNNVDVVPPPPNEGGVPQPLNAAPVGNAVSRPFRGLGGSSYLDALNRPSPDDNATPPQVVAAITTPEVDNSREVIAFTRTSSSTPSRGKSYLDSL